MVSCVTQKAPELSGCILLVVGTSSLTCHLRDFHGGPVVKLPSKQGEGSILVGRTEIPHVSWLKIKS